MSVSNPPTKPRRGNGYMLWCKENLAQFRTADKPNPREIFPVMAQHWKAMPSDVRESWNARWRDIAKAPVSPLEEQSGRKRKAQELPAFVVPVLQQLHSVATGSHEPAPAPAPVAMPSVITPVTTASMWNFATKAGVSNHQIFVLEDVVIHIVPRAMANGTVANHTSIVQLTQTALTLAQLTDGQSQSGAEDAGAAAAANPTVKVEERDDAKRAKL